VFSLCHGYFRAAAREFAKFHSKKTSDLAISKYGHLLNPGRTEMERVFEDYVKKWAPDYSHDKAANEV
jgi:hypothetical protein